MNRKYREQAVKNHHARTNPKLSEVPLDTHYNGKGEAEIVPGYQLAKVMQDWTVKFLQGRNPNIDNKFEGPVQWLAAQTGIHPRRVSGICNGEFEAVPLSQADKLLQAIERPDLLGKEVQVLPNPNWSLERWIEHMQERGCI